MSCELLGIDKGEPKLPFVYPDLGNSSLDNVPTYAAHPPALTHQEKKVIKITKQIKKTEQRIDKKEKELAKVTIFFLLPFITFVSHSFIQEKQHLEDLKVELKKASAEFKQQTERQPGERPEKKANSAHPRTKNDKQVH